MNKYILAFAIVALTAKADNLGLGDSVFANSETANQNISLGDFVGMDSRFIYGNIGIGRSAMEGTTNVMDCIAIGTRAGRGLSNCYGAVMIGNGVGANQFLPDSTSLNGHFFASPLAGGIFCINPTRAENFIDAPLYYKQGTLYINADVEMRNSLAITGIREIHGYDFYLAECGRDSNDGRTWKTPKRTIHAVWKAAKEIAEKEDFTCAVFPGTYWVESAMSSRELIGDGWPADDKTFVEYPKRVEFYSLDGKDKTTISAPLGNLDREDSEYVNLAMSLNDSWRKKESGSDSGLLGRGPLSDAYIPKFQSFHGFTFKRFASTYKESLTNGDYGRTCPAFLGMRFYDCNIEECIFWDPALWGAVAGCVFERTNIRNCEFIHSGGSSHMTRIFLGCSFKDSTITDCTITHPEDETKSMYIYSNSKGFVESYVCVTNMTSHDHLANGVSGALRSSTIVLAGDTYGSESTNVVQASSNCFWIVGYYPSAKGTDNVFALTREDAQIDANGVPKSTDCPAVRFDGRDDAGWKNSGLAALKIAKTRADLRYIDGVLYIYQDGVAVATIAASPYDAPAPASARMFASLPPSQSFESEEEDAHEEIKLKR